jgi:uncharacterized membrane protein
MSLLNPIPLAEAIMSSLTQTLSLLNHTFTEKPKTPVRVGAPPQCLKVSFSAEVGCSRDTVCSRIAFS